MSCRSKRRRRPPRRSRGSGSSPARTSTPRGDADVDTTRLARELSHAPGHSMLSTVAADIELLLTDVDGVLTDGSLTFDAAGVETKTFNVRDGLGIRLWQRAGGRVGIVTGRASRIVETRAAELDIKIVCQAVGEKLTVVRDIARQEDVPLERIAYLGDDLPDLPVIRAVGLGAAVADAAPELLEEAGHVTKTPGGRGALRELVDDLLKASGRWQAATGSLHG